MANLIPDIRCVCLLGALTLAAVPLSAQESPALQPDMPITIDADSSEFDYETNRLVFRGLRLDQGNLGIRADLAETDKLDFNEGEWRFSGNVLVQAENTTLRCDAAQLTFRNHQLINATLQGAPASFEQPAPESERTNSGAANEIVYEMNSGSLRLVGDAKFSDGVNEISGDLITYDLMRSRLTAGSGDSGPVKILIEPPARDPGADESTEQGQGTDTNQ